MYYTWKDYEVIDEILSYKLTKMNRKANIKHMELWHIGFGKRFCTSMFKYVDDKIKDWNEKSRKRKLQTMCYRIFNNNLPFVD